MVSLGPSLASQLGGFGRIVSPRLDPVYGNYPLAPDRQPQRTLGRLFPPVPPVLTRLLEIGNFLGGSDPASMCPFTCRRQL